MSESKQREQAGAKQAEESLEGLEQFLLAQESAIARKVHNFGLLHGSFVAMVGREPVHKVELIAEAKAQKSAGKVLLNYDNIKEIKH